LQDLRLSSALPAVRRLGLALTKNTVVRASAGTGKTYKLVETWVKLVDEDGDPLRIVAVTFTEKAAADMRARIREAILDRMKTLLPADRAKWSRVLSLLPAAPISTIHGFCGKLLREHGTWAGIDPSFSILDEQRSLDLAREAAVETIRNEIRNGNEKVAELFAGLGLDGLTEALVGTAYWMNSLGKDARWLREQSSCQLQAGEQLHPSVAEYMEQFGNDFDRIGVFADEQDAKKSKHPFRKREESDAILPRIGQIAGAAVAAELAKLIELSVQCFTLKKRGGNALDFDDLLLETRNLLRDSQDVRRRCQTHFQAVLVDEFQDTDEVQAEIISLLARDPADERHFAPGKLMIVGDPKQSIYRFRRARVTVFMRMMKEIVEDGGTLEHLRQNRRSAPPLAEFSNRLSESMMDGKGREDLIDDVDLSYRICFEAADVLEPRCDRQFLGLTYIAANPDIRAGVGRSMEARAIVRLLKAWRSAGTIQSWNQVAVLMRGMNHASTYIDALESAGIPVHVVDGPSFYQKSEVSDLIALLEFVLHPKDPLIRAIVLSSALAGLTFPDLLAGKSSETFDQVVEPWIERRDRATAAEILEDVVRKTNFDAVMMAQKNGRQRVANIGKLIEITRNLGREGTTSLDDVVRYLRARAHDVTVRESEAQTTSQEADVIRLLTVHGAKGLEFDVVIVPDLAAQVPHGSNKSLLHSDKWGLLAGAAYGLHRRTLPHSLILRGREEDKDQQFEEEKRLLYVAVTRARKMLVLAEGFAGKRAGLWQRWTSDLFERVQPGALDRARQGKTTRVRFRSRGQDFSVEVLSAAEFTRPEQLPLNIDIATVNRETAFREFKEMSDALERRPARPLASIEMTPSDLGALWGCFRYFHWTRLMGINEPGFPLTGNELQLRIGSTVHALLESGRELSVDVLREKGLLDLEPVFQSKEWRALAKADVERELPFIMHVRAGSRNCFIRGRMDAVVSAHPPRVIDYKYALWRSGGEAEYEIQMMAYCLAVMKSSGSDRAVGELWYLKSPMKVLHREYSYDEAERTLSGILERYLQSLSSGTWPAAERSYCDATECGFRERCWAK
jgi:ATP-dependent exoDNAse (exonuclease V) beta subunit